MRIPGFSPTPGKSGSNCDDRCRHVVPPGWFWRLGTGTRARQNSGDFPEIRKREIKVGLEYFSRNELASRYNFTAGFQQALELPHDSAIIRKMLHYAEDDNRIIGLWRCVLIKIAASTVMKRFAGRGQPHQQRETRNSGYHRCQENS